mgnify:FL=1
MYWHKKKIDYDILIPPINKQFKNFTKKEAESYFEWYKNQLNPRIEYLRKYSGVDLGYSVNSLVDIWGWFLKIAETEKAPKAKTEEVRNRLKSQPKEIIEDVLNEQSRQFSLETEYIIRDIAMYFGEVYVKNNSSIAWGYHTDVKADSFANMPLLVGFEDRDFTPAFKTHFEPLFMIHAVACNIFDGDQTKEDLLLLYNKWQRMVYN